jgi:hypothetical protein
VWPSSDDRARCLVEHDPDKGWASLPTYVPEDRRRFALTVLQKIT